MWIPGERNGRTVREADRGGSGGWVGGTAGLGDSLRKTAEQAVEEREAIRLAAAKAEREALQQPRL